MELASEDQGPRWGARLVFENFAALSEITRAACRFATSKPARNGEAQLADSFETLAARINNSATPQSSTAWVYFEKLLEKLEAREGDKLIARPDGTSRREFHLSERSGVMEIWCLKNGRPQFGIGLTRATPLTEGMYGKPVEDKNEDECAPRTIWRNLQPMVAGVERARRKELIELSKAIATRRPPGAF